MRQTAAGAAATLAVLSLVTNRLPALTLGAFLLAALLSIRRVERLTLGVAAVWAFWTLSFLLSGETLSTLAAFDFHRRDGQIFFSLLPLLILAAVAPTEERIRSVALAFGMLQGIVVLVGMTGHCFGLQRALVGWVFLWDEGINPHGPGFTALYLTHNAAGSVLGLGCLTFSTLAVFGPRGKFRSLCGALAGLCLWGVLLSKSRGSLLSLGGGLALLAWIGWKRNCLDRRLLLGSGAVLLLTLGLLGPLAARRVGQFAAAEGTHTWRLQQWKRALTEWSWSPLLGEGMGRFNDEDRQWTGVKHVYYAATQGRAVNDAGHAHNSYVHFLAEGGLVGLGVSVGLWAWLAWSLRKARAPLRVAALLGVLYLFAISMTEHYMGGGILHLVLSCLVGAAWKLPELAAPAEPIMMTEGGRT